MFAKILFKNGNKEAKHISERFEYFHHYWTLLFLTKTGKGSQLLLKPNYLFIEEDRIESHRSLFVKINKQLTYNYPKAEDKLEHLFVQHPYFSVGNILIRKYPVLVRNVNCVNQEISSVASNSNFRTPQVKKRIHDAFRELEKQLLLRYPYEKRLATQLYKTLSLNKHLDKEAKDDIKFLVNAFIVELYQYGYSKDYIERIPNIISRRDHLEDFPYDKTPRDFESDNAYNGYVEGEKSKMNLEVMLSGLSKLVNGRKYKGYMVFKVNGINIEQSIKLQGVEFYNPQEERKAKDYYDSMDPELFMVKTSPEESGTSSKPSTCNAIVSTSILSPSNRSGPQILREAYRQVEAFSLLLSNLLNRYTDTTFGTVSVNPQRKKCILFFESNGIPVFTPREIFGKADNSHIVEFQYEQNRAWLREEVNFFNSTDLDSKAGKRVIALLSQQKMLENEAVAFNFKDLWTAWEGMFEGEGKKEKFIGVSINAVRIYLSTNFLPRIKHMLYRSLRLDNFLRFDCPSGYYLEEKSVELLGLDIPGVRQISLWG